MVGTLEAWLPATAAVRGRSHERGGLPCQDVVESRRRGRVAAIALADGAGSAKFSEAGATAAVQAALAWLLRHAGRARLPTERSVREGMGAAVRKAIEAQVTALNTVPGELGCTLLFVAVSPAGFVLGHVGDGVIASRVAGAPGAISAPRDSEFINQTFFVTSVDAFEKMVVKIGEADSVDAFALMSDGAAESLYLRAQDKLAPAVSTVWSWLDTNAPAAVSDALRKSVAEVMREKTGDDCALALLRKVVLDSEELLRRPPAFQQAFLACGNRRGLASRLRVMSLALASPGEIDLETLKTASGLSLHSAKSHLRAVRAVLRAPRPKPESET